MQDNIFHLAIPCLSVDVTEAFYLKLGSKVSRKNDQRIIFNFFGAQLVCHRSPENIDSDPNMYPRHFGIILKQKSEYEEVLNSAKNEELEFFQEHFIRYEGRPEEHWTFFLKDPSNNLIEFKFYRDELAIYKS